MIRIALTNHSREHIKKSILYATGLFPILLNTHWLRNERSGVRYLPPPCYVLEQRHIYSPKFTGNTQEAVAPSRHDWKIVDWGVKYQHKQNKIKLGFKRCEMHQNKYLLADLNEIASLLVIFLKIDELYYLRSFVLAGSRTSTS